MTLLKTLIPVVLSILVTGPAFALSCLPYSARHAFQAASQSPDRYVLVYGQLAFNIADHPVADMAHQELIQPDNFFAASATGFSLTGSGFDAQFTRQIQVNVQCAGPWCGAMDSGPDYLMFLRQTSSGYLLETGPCGGFAFYGPTPETLDDMHQCLLGEDCTPPQY